MTAFIAILVDLDLWLTLKSFEIGSVGCAVGSYLTLMSFHVLRGAPQAPAFAMFAEPP